MDRQTQQQIRALAVKFSAILGKLVQLTYCVGAASEDEIRAAHIEYLLSIAKDLKREMTQDVYVPTKRY